MPQARATRDRYSTKPGVEGDGRAWELRGVRHDWRARHGRQWLAAFVRSWRRTREDADEAPGPLRRQFPAALPHPSRQIRADRDAEPGLLRRQSRAAASHPSRQNRAVGDGEPGRRPKQFPVAVPDPSRQNRGGGCDANGFDFSVLHNAAGCGATTRLFRYPGRPAGDPPARYLCDFVSLAYITFRSRKWVDSKFNIWLAVIQLSVCHPSLRRFRRKRCDP